MRIIRIHRGKLLPLPFRLVALVLNVSVTLLIMHFLVESIAIPLAILNCALMPGIWFAAKVLIIDHETRTQFDGIWTMGLKFGKPTSYTSIEKVWIEKHRISPTTFSLPNKKEIITNEEYRAYLQTDLQKIYLLSHPVKDRLTEKVSEIKRKLKIDAGF